MEHGTNNPEPSWPQSAYTRAYAAAEPGLGQSVSTSFVDEHLGDLANLNRSTFAENNRGSIVDYGHADPWATSHPSNHTLAPFTDLSPSHLTGSTFAAGFTTGAAYNDGTALPTAPFPYAWEVAAPAIHSNNNTFAPFVNSNLSPLTENNFAANATYNGGITYPTAPSPYTLGAAAPAELMNHYMGPGLQFPDPALAMMDPFAADTNGNCYHGQFPATSFSTQLGGAAIEPPTASHATLDSDAVQLDLAQRTPPPRPTCPTCNRSFGRQADLDRHAKKHQADAKVFRCGCGYSSYRKDKLDEHVRRSGHQAVVVSVNGV